MCIYIYMHIYIYICICYVIYIYTYTYIEAKIQEVRRSEQELKFSERYGQSPPGPDACRTVMYQQELDERALKFGQLMVAVCQSPQLIDRLEKRFDRLEQHVKSLDGAAEVTPLRVHSTSCVSASFEPLRAPIEEALRVAKKEVLEFTAKVLGGSSAGNLPRFGEFALDYVERKVQHHLDRSLEQLRSVIELESLAVVTPPRTCQTTGETTSVALPVFGDDVCVGLLMSGDADECAICSDSLTKSESVHLLRCCSKMFHKACLEGRPGQSAGGSSPLMRCPLCRVNIGSAHTAAEAAATAARKGLPERRRQVVGQATNDMY